MSADDWQVIPGKKDRTGTIAVAVFCVECGRPNEAMLNVPCLVCGGKLMKRHPCPDLRAMNEALKVLNAANFDSALAGALQSYVDTLESCDSNVIDEIQENLRAASLQDPTLYPFIISPMQLFSALLCEKGQIIQQFCLPEAREAESYTGTWAVSQYCDQAFGSLFDGAGLTGSFSLDPRLIPVRVKPDGIVLINDVRYVIEFKTIAYDSGIDQQKVNKWLHQLACQQLAFPDCQVLLVVLSLQSSGFAVMRATPANVDRSRAFWQGLVGKIFECKTWFAPIRWSVLTGEIDRIDAIKLIREGANKVRSKASTSESQKSKGSAAAAKRRGPFDFGRDEDEENSGDDGDA